MRRAMRNRPLIEAYLSARETIVAMGFGAEIDWQESRCLATLTEAEFLREAAWVILCSGMRETVVRNLFDRISHAFLNWSSSSLIATQRALCEARALNVFNHPRKIAAIGSVCERVALTGFDRIRSLIESQGLEFLQRFDFIGRVTAYHLGKNVGLDIAKPDRHLVRIARVVGAGNPYQLCQAISSATGDKISVVDLVFWRYATLNPTYTKMFRRELR